jgi:DNA-binding transcriptional LysR family regulator
MNDEDATDWDEFRFFLAAAEAGNFSEASRVLGASQPTVSRRIARLERRLGAALFHRTAQGVRLTATGERMRQVGDEMRHLLGCARMAAAAEGEVSGTVRLWVTDGIGGYWLPPKLAAFHREHPGVTVDVLCRDAPPPPERLGNDIAVTYDAPASPDAAVLASAVVSFAPFASVEYLREFGRPERLDEPRRHRVCQHLSYPASGDWAPWAAVLDGHPMVSFRTDSSIALGYATLFGAGVSMQPIAVAAREPGLVMLDGLDCLVTLQFWLVCHRDARGLPRMQALADHIRTSLFDRDAGGNERGGVR